MASSCLAQTHREMIITTPVRVEAFVVARNGKIAAGWGNDGRVRMWNLTSRQVLRSFEPNIEGASQVCALSNLPCGLLLSQDGRRLFLGDSKGGVHIWDSTTGEVRFETALGHYIGTAALSREAPTLAVARNRRAGTGFRLAFEAVAFPAYVRLQRTDGTGLLARGIADRFCRYRHCDTGL